MKRVGQIAVGGRVHGHVLPLALRQPGASPRRPQIVVGGGRLELDDQLEEPDAAAFGFLARELRGGRVGGRAIRRQ